MKNERGDLYLLVDGTHAAPGDCSAGKDGVMRHTSGMAVAMREDGKPQTVGGDAIANKNLEAAQLFSDDSKAPAPAEIKARRDQPLAAEVSKPAEAMPPKDAKPDNDKRE